MRRRRWFAVGRRFHLIVRRDGGVHLYSPQIPELIAGRDTPDELFKDLPDIVSFAAPDLDLRDAIIHQEEVFSVPEGDFVLRVALDDHASQREHVQRRIAAALQVPTQVEDMLDAPRTRSGLLLFVCAVPSDTVRTLMEELDPRGDAAVVAASVADELLWTTHVAYDDETRLDWHPLDHWGWTLDTSVAEMLRDGVVATRPRRVLISN
jgi:hypothetical protein